MRISKAQARKLETLRHRLASTKGNASRLFDDLLTAIKQAEQKLNAGIALHNEAVAEADDFVRDVAQELEAAYDDKSETWKEGDAGQAAREFVDEWLGADLDAVKAVRVMRPDEPDFGDYELKLAEESES